MNEQQTRDELVSNIAVLDSEIAEMALDIKKAQGQRRLDLILELDSKFFDRNLSARLLNTPTTSRDQYADIFSELDGKKRKAGWLERKIDRMAMEWERNPELKSSALRSTLIKYSWFLIPLSLPGMIIFMPGGYADRFKHAIFIGYSISFVLFFASLLMILIRFEIPDAPLFATSIIIMMIHLFIQTKNSYRLSWPKAIWHYLVVLGCAVFALAFFAVILFLLNLI